MKTIPLTQGKVALVDDKDYAALSKFKWHTRTSRRKLYAVRRESKFQDPNRPFVRMHRQILGVSRELEVDHRDGDGLNNQRHNLRSATSQQNSRASQSKRAGATSQYRGVSRHSDGNWTAHISLEGKSVYLGYFKDETLAACAYDQAALKHYKTFAQLNFS